MVGAMVEQHLAQQHAIVEYLARHGSASVDDIAGATGLDRPAARQRVRDAIANGVVARDGTAGGALVYRSTVSAAAVADWRPTPRDGAGNPVAAPAPPPQPSVVQSGDKIPDLPPQPDRPDIIDSTPPAPEQPAPVPFDPSEHGVREIRAHLADSDDAERARVIDLERAGRARKSILDLG